MNNYDEQLLKFIADYPVNFHVIAGQIKILKQEGYEQLFEYDEWKLKAGGRYFTMRNDSSLIAFRIPKDTPQGFRIVASHSDSPCFKLKENPEIRVEQSYTKLNVEVYGGTPLALWFDRPLSIAGRIIVKENETLVSKLIDFKKNMAVIPSLAIHMNRDINKGYVYNVQKDLLPLYGKYNAVDLLNQAASLSGVKRENIAGSDLFLYNKEAPCFWGASNEYMSSPRLDDVQCSFASLNGLIECNEHTGIAVHAVFDNEEVGSATRQGAASTFLKDTMKRILSGIGFNETDFFVRQVSQSFLLSADNAHAFHPNYPEKCDPVNKPVPGNGIVLKYSANQKYTTDGFSAAVVRTIAEYNNIPLQIFVNRSDVIGGSTLGNISCNQVPIPSADIGIAQFSMHSPYETCAKGDTELLVRLTKALFESNQKSIGISCN